MKISDDMDYIILFTQNSHMYALAYDPSAETEKSKKKSKIKCSNCNKEIAPNNSRLPSFMDIYNNPNSKIETGGENDTENDKVLKNKKDLICEECQILVMFSENFLYEF